MDGYRRSETRTSSQTSRFIGDESGDYDQQDSPMIESTSTEWTDEKHSLYLKSMEASFVDQLYNSMDILGRRSQKRLSDPKSSEQVYSSNCAPSGQFKVLRHGSWQKINFQRPESQQSRGNESYGLLTSPWIQHFRSARKPHVVQSSTLQETATSERQAINLSGKKAMTSGSAISSKHLHLCHSYICDHDLLDSNTEVSDQNFVDEDIKCEKGSITCSSKRMKTLTTVTSSSDQVVPFGKLPVTEDVTGKCISAAR